MNHRPVTLGLAIALAVSAPALAQEPGARDVDFARLAPADTIFYLELNQPGQQLKQLCDQLGLLGAGRDGTTFGLSPRLIDGLFGVGGFAVAVTGIDPRQGPTDGLLIVDPGRLDIVAGLIETALPMAGAPVEPIAGNPTYHVAGQAFVTLTESVVLASPRREQVEAAVARMRGRGRSIRDNDDLAGAMKLRGDDLMFCCLNFEPVMPMVQKLIQREARGSREIRAALAFLDIGSTKCLAGRMGVDDDGVSFDVSLELDERHRNIAFNLLRMPNVDRASMGLVPEGAAMFAVGSVNSRGQMPPATTDARGEPVVTLMDFGRELFSNLTDFAVYVMPRLERTPFGPMPEAALALRVNDPARSRALWEFVLSTAQAAAGEPAPRGEGDSRVQRYSIQGANVFLASRGDRLFVSTSQQAIVAATDGGNRRTVVNDGAFAGALKQFGDSATRVFAMNLGRCAEIAQRFMSERERRELTPFLGLVTDTTVSCSLQHSSNRLGLHGRITGIPDVGPILQQLIEREMGGSRAMRRVGKSR